MASSRWQLPLSSAGITISASGVNIPALRLWMELGFARRAALPLRRHCLFDTGAPLSVIPFEIHQAQDFAWQSIPGPWPSSLTTWMGVPCTVGWIHVWGAMSVTPYFFGPWKFI